MSSTYLDKPRAKAVIQGIFAAMESGAWFTRAQLVQRFIDGGYAEHLAISRADALIAANTDIDHHSRWTISCAGPTRTYTISSTPARPEAEPTAEPTNLGWIVQRREDDPNNPGWWRYGRPTWEPTDMSWCPGSRWSWGTPSDLTTAQATWDASH